MLTYGDNEETLATIKSHQLNKHPDVSVVVPLYNESENIVMFLNSLLPVMDNIGYNYEILLVNDGSSDDTWSIIQLAAKKYSPVKGISLSRNFGHQNALFAGLNVAKGQAIISMDGDLQHPPSVLPKLLEQWRKGYKVVTTKRIYSKNTPWLKRITSKLFYRIFSKLSGLEMSEGSSDFRLIDRCILIPMISIRDNNLFLRGITNWLGFPSIQIEFTAPERFAGESKYNLVKMIQFSLDAVISFSITPLKIGVWLGFFTSLLAIVEIIYILIVYFSGGTIAGWTSVMVFMSIMFSILFFMIGLLGLYIGSVIEMSKKRPRFIISEATDYKSLDSDIIHSQ